MGILEKIITALVLIVVSGALVLAVMYGQEADDTALLCAASMIFSLAVIVTACIIYFGRRPTEELLEDMEKSQSIKTNEFVELYRSKTAFKVTVMISMAVFVFVLAILSIYVGQQNISFSDIIRLLWGHITGVLPEMNSPDWYNDILIWDVRLPRALVAVVAGAALAVGGAVMQGAVKNPLADPYTTGISSGAVFGASLFIVLGFSITGLGQYGIIANAFMFSLIPAIIMIFVSRITNSSPVTIILVGTAVSYIFSSFDTLVMMLADEHALKDAFEWQVGSLSGVSWDTLPVMTFFTVVLSSILFLTSNKLNLMMAGDREARSLGLNVDNYRMLCLVIISLLTASVVSYIGLIGFLGLITPHVVRMLIGSDSRMVLPASAIMGAAVMLVADIIARMVGTAAIPVGVVMSFIGGPLFLLLVMKSRREAWSDEV